jgi:hypothetical protein
MKKEGKKMPEEMTLQETFKLKRDTESYIERWENVQPEEDPLLKSWKKHIDENKSTIEKTRKRK